MKPETKIKKQLISILETNGFRNCNPKKNRYFSYIMQRKRGELEVSFHKEYIEVYLREYPASEGWSTNNYDYSDSSIKSIEKYIAWNR